MTLSKSYKNNSYKEIMDRIEVTDEMRSRILNNVVLSSEKKRLPFPRTSRYLSAVSYTHLTLPTILRV